MKSWASETLTRTPGADSGRFKARFGRYDTLIFLHLPKTAGTTLRGIIDRQYRRYRIYRMYRPEERAARRRLISSLPPEKLREIGLLEGHMEFGWHTMLPQKSVYVTMLREPVDRVISSYYYIRRDSSHRLHGAIRGGAMGLEEYLEKRINIEANNGQTRWLSGSSPESQSGLREDAFERAKENLENHFPVIGIQERFDESLILFRRMFAWGKMYYSSRNVTSSRPKRQAMTDRVLGLIRDLNRMDIDLYEYATKRFNEAVLGEGASFESEVAHFKVANRTYGKFVSPLLDTDPRDMMRDANSELRSLVKAKR